MSDDLIARARAASEGFVVPASWGEAVELDEGDGVFVGRFRGQETDIRGEPIYMFWDEDGAPRFFWHAYRLRQGVERDQPAVGDTVCIVRGANYETRFDEAGEASGLAYGVATEPNGAPLPEAPPTADEPAADDDIPF